VNPSTDAAPIVGLVVLKEGKIFIPWNTHCIVLLQYIQCHAFLQEKFSKKARRSATITKRWAVTTPELHYAKRRHPPHAAFRTRLVSVYSGLTDEEAQRLASRHNHATSLQHKMSSWEKVQHACMHDYHHLKCPIQCLQIQFCRNSLYKLTNTPYDAQTPTKPKNWRRYCARLLMDEVYTCIYHTG